MADPIKPGDVGEQKLGVIPAAVYEAFNELIVIHYYNGRATFTQKEVLKLIVSRGISHEDIFSNHYLDIEIAYEKAGWKVVYDKPGFNESYEPTFSFIEK